MFCQFPKKSEFIIGILDFPNDLLPVYVDLCRFVLIDSQFMSIYVDLWLIYFDLCRFMLIYVDLLIENQQISRDGEHDLILTVQH